jgi:hypothetical protein
MRLKSPNLAKATFLDKREIFLSEMENEIVKLFEEFDLMTLFSSCMKRLG